MTTASISQNSALFLPDWLVNYRAKIAVYGTTCGLGAAEIAATLADIAYFVFLLQELQELHQNVSEKAHKFTDYKQHMIYGYSHSHSSLLHPLSSMYPNMPPAPAPGIHKRLLEQIARIKTSSHYTKAIGHELGILSSNGITPTNSAKQLIGVGNRVRKDILSYDYEGIWIDGHLSGADWAFFPSDLSR